MRLRSRLGPLALAISCVLVSSPAHAGDKPLQRIGFGSCVHQDKPQPIWQSIVAAKPDLFIMAGDNIYGDTKDMDVLKKKYDQLGAQPGYQALTKQCPLLAIWDDHDYGVNDGGTDYPKKKESQQLLLDFFGIAKDSPRRQREGVYHAEVFGPPEKRVQVILLDTRYHRSALKKKAGVPRGIGPYLGDASPDKTLLGEAQWKWLDEQLQVPAKIRLLVTGIQVVSEDHGWEKWMNLPHERARLYKLIADRKASGVIVLSGDRHLAELSLMNAGIGYPLYDLTSSGLNQAFTKWRPQESQRHRVATMNHGHNFGMVLIDWEQDDPLIRLQIRDEAGEVTIQQKLPLSMLQPGALTGQADSAARLASGETLTEEVVAKHLKKSVSVELTVRASGMTPKLIFLNSATDRSSTDNFTIVLDDKAQAKLKEAGIEQPRKHYEGKTIRVTGTLSLFQMRPQIIVSDPKAIEVIREKE